MEEDRDLNKELDEIIAEMKNRPQESSPIKEAARDLDKKLDEFIAKMKDRPQESLPSQGVSMAGTSGGGSSPSEGHLARPDSPLERLRLRYRPGIVKVLFIGESPPNNGTFFYQADSNLFRYTNAAFQEVYSYRIGSGERFLRFFQSLGCWLDDLCLAPGKPTREQQRLAIPSVAARMKEAQPTAVVCVILGIEKCVRDALRRVELDELPAYFLPFPAQSNQSRYVVELVATLTELRATESLD